MSKVLISFLGTGPSDLKGSRRVYRQAMYQFEDGTQIETSFVADALVQHHNIDRVILIGTMKSMWERVYEVFCEKSGIAVDEDYYLELGDKCERSNANTSLVLPGVERLEKLLGEGSHVTLIRYGLNKEEIKQNESIILGLEQYIHSGDELFVDITHSFRSLPLFLMNLLIYLKNVSKKKINISHILYGMLDVTRELGYAPVVDLSDIMTINEWITGAYALSQFGNGQKIAELLEGEEDRDTSSRIAKFSNMLSLNHMDGIGKQAQELSALKNRQFSPIPQRIIPTVVDGFVKKFNGIKHLSELQYQVAWWHFEHHNYSSAYLSLIESIITFICEKGRMNVDDVDNRNIAKDLLMKRDKDLLGVIPKLENLRQIYTETNEIRKQIAHSLSSVYNDREMISILKDSLIQLEDLILIKSSNNRF